MAAEPHIPVAADLVRTYEAISAALNRRQPLATTLDLIAEQVARTLGHRYCAIALHDEQAGSFEIRGSYGLSREYLDLANELLRVQIQRDGIAQARSLTLRAFRNRLPTQVHDITTDPMFDDWRELAQLAGYSSAVFLPLLFRDDAIGVLSCYDIARTYTAEDVDALQPVAEQTATAVGIARLLDRQQGVIDELEHATQELDERNATLRTTADATRELTRLLLRHCTLDELVEELHRWLRAPVTVCDPRMQELARFPSSSGPRDGSADDAVVPVNGPDVVHGYLVVSASANGTDTGPRPSLEPAAMACALYFMREQAASERELRVTSQLLYDLLNVELPATETSRLASRLRLADGTPYRIVTVTPSGQLAGDNAAARRRVQTVTTALRRLDTGRPGPSPVVQAPVGLAVVAIVPGDGRPDDLAFAVHEALSTAGDHTVGISRTCLRSADFRRRHLELRRCQELAARSTGASSTVLVDDWHVHTMLMRNADDADVRGRAHEILDPVLTQPSSERLLKTVRAFIDSGTTVTTTASALHVHANTVKYRIRQIERLTGLRSDRLLDLMELQVALTVLDLDRSRFDAEAYTSGD